MRGALAVRLWDTLQGFAWKGIFEMKKRILAGLLCVLFGMFCCVTGCEKKSKEETAVGDAVKSVEKAADKAVDKAEDVVDEAKK